MLNADRAWCPASASRSMDLDDLPAAGAATPPLRSPPSASGATAGETRRYSAITQSMPAFNRDALRALQLPGSSGGSAARGARRSGVGRPLPPRGLVAAAAADAARPGTAAPRARRGAHTNPRAPGSLQLLDCLLAPDVSRRISALDARAATPPLPPLDESGVIKAVHNQSANSSDHQQRSDSANNDDNDDDDVVQMRSSADSNSAGAGQAAVHDLMAEVRNVRYAGQPGADSDQIRLARLELKLKTLRVRASAFKITSSAVAYLSAMSNMHAT